MRISFFAVLFIAFFTTGCATTWDHILAKNNSGVLGSMGSLKDSELTSFKNQYGAEVNPFFAALTDCNDDVLKAFLKRGVDVNMTRNVEWWDNGSKERKIRSFTPLMRLSSYYDSSDPSLTKKMQLLIDAGADPWRVPEAEKISDKFVYALVNEGKAAEYKAPKFTDRAGIETYPLVGFLRNEAAFRLLLNNQRFPIEKAAIPAPVLKYLVYSLTQRTYNQMWSQLNNDYYNEFSPISNLSPKDFLSAADAAYEKKEAESKKYNSINHPNRHKDFDAKNTDLLIDLLSMRKEMINLYKDYDFESGHNLLHYAVVSGNVKLFDFLAANGAKLETGSPISTGSLEVVLLDALKFEQLEKLGGAADKVRLKALHDYYAAERPLKDKAESAVLMAAYQKNTDKLNGMTPQLADMKRQAEVDKFSGKKGSTEAYNRMVGSYNAIIDENALLQRKFEALQIRVKNADTKVLPYLKEKLGQ